MEFGVLITIEKAANTKMDIRLIEKMINTHIKSKIAAEYGAPILQSLKKTRIEYS